MQDFSATLVRNSNASNFHYVQTLLMNVSQILVNIDWLGRFIAISICYVILLIEGLVLFSL